MEINELQIGIQAVIGLSVGIISAAGVWFKMKSKVEILNIRLKTTEENNRLLHNRINNQKNDLKALGEKVNDTFTQIRDDIHDMESNILDRITEIYKKYNK